MVLIDSMNFIREDSVELFACQALNDIFGLFFCFDSDFSEKVIAVRVIFAVVNGESLFCYLVSLARLRHCAVHGDSSRTARKALFAFPESAGMNFVLHIDILERPRMNASLFGGNLLWKLYFDIGPFFCIVYMVP